jgi:lipoprotein signal peptidase
VRRRSLLLALVAVILVVVLDQASKQWILQFFDDTPGRLVPLTGFLNLALIFNHGISFGVLNNAGPLNALIFTVLAVVIVAGLVAWLWRSDGFLLPAAIGMVIGGAVGNVVDRLARGAVTDFLDFHLGEWHWFVFNLADAAICVGVGLMVIDSLVGRREAPR